MLKVFANVAIDTIQEGKKHFVSTLISHEPLAKILKDFVDAQTAYTKSAAATTIDTSLNLAKLITSKTYFGGK